MLSLWQYVHVLGKVMIIRHYYASMQIYNSNVIASSIELMFISLWFCNVSLRFLSAKGVNFCFLAGGSNSSSSNSYGDGVFGCWLNVLSNCQEVVWWRGVPCCCLEVACDSVELF